jgi:hypothetical protein
LQSGAAGAGATAAGFAVAVVPGLGCAAGFAPVATGGGALVEGGETTSGGGGFAATGSALAVAGADAAAAGGAAPELSPPAASVLDVAAAGGDELAPLCRRSSAPPASNASVTATAVPATILPPVLAPGLVCPHVAFVCAAGPGVPPAAALTTDVDCGSGKGRESALRV